jgi:hypothetical protein
MFSVMGTTCKAFDIGQFSFAAIANSLNLSADKPGICEAVNSKLIPDILASLHQVQQLPLSLAYLVKFQLL